MTAETYDFRKPTPLPAAARAALGRWHSLACQAIDKQLADRLPFPVTLAPASLEIQPAGRALAGLAESDLVFRAGRANGAGDCWLAVPRPAVLAVVGGLLGEPLAPEELGRELTPVEEGLADYAAEELFLAPLQRAWPLRPALELAPPSRAKPGEPGPAGPDLLVATFRADGPFGEACWRWAVPRDWAAGGEAAAGAGPDRREREALVCELPLRLTVSLGSARVPLAHLARLARGDVLLLEQPVDEPLTAALGGQVKFLVWPGAVGARQAVAIHSPVGP